MGMASISSSHRKSEKQALETAAAPSACAAGGQTGCFGTTRRSIARARSKLEAAYHTADAFIRKVIQLYSRRGEDLLRYFYLRVKA